MKKLLVLLIALMLLTAFSASALTIRRDSEEAIAAEYAFTLEGVDYALPMPVSELIAAGWESRYADSELAGKSYTGSIIFKKGDASVNFTVLNAADYVRPFRECTVVGVSVDADNTAELVTAGGLRRGMAFADVFDMLGIMVETEEDGDILLTVGEETERRAAQSNGFDVEYRLAGENANYLKKVLTSFYGENKISLLTAAGGDMLAEGALVDSLDITYMAPTAADEALESSATDEIPEQYSAYEGFAGTMPGYTFYGKQYYFPTPLAVMGDELDYIADAAMAGGSEKRITSSHGVSVSATVKNPLDVEIPVKHGYISYLDIDRQEIDFALEGSLRIGSPEADVLTLYPAFDGLEDSYIDEAAGIWYSVIRSGDCNSYWISPLDETGFTSLGEIWIDTENGLVSEIRLSVVYSDWI